MRSIKHFNGNLMVVEICMLPFIWDYSYCLQHHLRYSFLRIPTLLIPYRKCWISWHRKDTVTTIIAVCYPKPRNIHCCCLSSTLVYGAPSCCYGLLDCFWWIKPSTLTVSPSSWWVWRRWRLVWCLVCIFSALTTFCDETMGLMATGPLNSPVYWNYDVCWGFVEYVPCVSLSEQC